MSTSCTYFSKLYTIFGKQCRFRSAGWSVVTCRERAYLLALLCVVFSWVFVAFPHGVLSQVWYLIVSIPDLCLLPYFLIKPADQYLLCRSCTLWTHIDILLSIWEIRKLALILSIFFFQKMLSAYYYIHYAPWSDCS